MGMTSGWLSLSWERSHRPSSRLQCNQCQYRCLSAPIHLSASATRVHSQAMLNDLSVGGTRRMPIAQQVFLSMNYRRTQIVFRSLPAGACPSSSSPCCVLSGLWRKLLSFQPERILKCLPNLMCIGNSMKTARLYAPTQFHVEGFSAGSYTGATIVIALCKLFPECPVSATLGAIAMPKGIMGALIELASPGHCIGWLHDHSPALAGVSGMRHKDCYLMQTGRVTSSHFSDLSTIPVCRC